MVGKGQKKNIALELRHSAMKKFINRLYEKHNVDDRCSDIVLIINFYEVDGLKVF